uniref:Protein kinase domain-containing protein n=1 Tax=Sparus aurata TaxID=8175 RepID=A0A671YHT5_SPAAU
MTHLLNETETPSYVVEAHQFMAVCPTYHPDEADDSLTHTETDMESDLRAFKTDLQRVSSSASFCEKDLLTESFSGYNGDIESFSDDSSDMENYTGQHSGTRCFSGSNTDIETESDTKGSYHRGFFNKTQRDQSPVGDTGDLDTGPYNAYNREVDNIKPRETLQVQKNDILVSNSTRYLVMDFIGEGFLAKVKNDVLFSNSTHYLVMNFNGEGAFGKVAQCLNLSTNERVALKIHTQNEEHVIQQEVYMLEAIRALDPEKNNIVRFVESFRFNGLSCLAFEMLDKSLWDLMKESWTPLRLNEIRPVIHQLLVAFDALNSIGVIHTDLKPDNIMLVNHKDQPYRVKLIDFGLATPVNMLEAGDTVQPIGYRAPEVMLGLPLSEAIDMWGVGCVMAFLCFGRNLFPVDCPYHYMEVTGHKPQPSWNFFDTFMDLEEALQRYEAWDFLTYTKTDMELRNDQLFDLNDGLDTLMATAI